MKLAVNIKYFSKTIGMENAAKILKDAGILLLDYTPSAAETAGDVEKTAEIFEKYGLSVYQTHAPFNRYHTLDSVELHKQQVEKVLNETKALGGKFIVLHGDEFDFNNHSYSKDAVLKYNYEYFAPIVEKAAKMGINVAFENVFEDNFEGNPRFCSKTEDLAGLIDKYNASNVCACWDFGHGAVSNREQQSDAIRLLGKRIQCTHVHDNYLYSDEHMIPFFGKIDWQSCMDAMKTTNTEVLSFELVYGKHSVNTVPDIARLLRSTGDCLISLYH